MSSPLENVLNLGVQGMTIMTKGGLGKFGEKVGEKLVEKLPLPIIMGEDKKTMAAQLKVSKEILKQLKKKEEMEEKRLRKQEEMEEKLLRKQEEMEEKRLRKQQMVNVMYAQLELSKEIHRLLKNKEDSKKKQSGLSVTVSAKGVGMGLCQADSSMCSLQVKVKYQF